MGRKRSTSNFKKKKPLRWLRGLVCAGLLGALGIVSSDAYIEFSCKERIFVDVRDIPHRKVGLLLGTSKYSRHGTNLFYAARIDAAVALFEAKRIDYVLISGDNGTEQYNEPKTFRADLIARGIPSDRIVLDYAGFRTLDSVVRAKEVFQEDNFTVISQQFHVERALFIAASKGIDAIGFGARDVGGDRGMTVKVRERLARINMLFDLLTGKEPKFLGEKETIG